MFKSDGFEEQYNIYDKVYISLDNYYLAIRKNDNPQKLKLFLHNDWNKFKEMLDHYDKVKNTPFGLFTDISIEKSNSWEIDIPNFSTFNYMDSVILYNDNRAYWSPVSTSGNGYGQQYLYTSIMPLQKILQVRFNEYGVDVHTKVFKPYHVDTGI
jgi:hypothetical protein